MHLLLHAEFQQAGEWMGIQTSSSSRPRSSFLLPRVLPSWTSGSHSVDEEVRTRENNDRYFAIIVIVDERLVLIASPFFFTFTLPLLPLPRQRLVNPGKRLPDKHNEPNLFEISRLYPLPEINGNGGTAANSEDLQKHHYHPLPPPTNGSAFSYPGEQQDTLEPPHSTKVAPSSEYEYGNTCYSYANQAPKVNPNFDYSQHSWQPPTNVQSNPFQCNSHPTYYQHDYLYQYQNGTSPSRPYLSNSAYHPSDLRSSKAGYSPHQNQQPPPSSYYAQPQQHKRSDEEDVASYYATRLQLDEQEKESSTDSSSVLDGEDRQPDELLEDFASTYYP